MGEDAREIPVGEPARASARLQRPVDFLGSVQLGEVDRLGELAPQPLRPRRGGLDQPALRGRADLKERLLLGALSARPALKRTRRLGRIVLIADRRAARCGQRVAGDLRRPAVGVHVDHDQLLTIDPRPDALVDQLVRHRVAGAPDRDHRLPVHLPRLPETHGVRHPRETVQPLVLSRQADHRRLLRRAVRPGVHIGHPLLARRLELRPRSVGRAEVVIGGQQIGLRDPDCRLAAALGLRIGRHARLDRHPVMTGHRDDLRVADRDPAHMIDGHRLLVVGQHVGRRATERTQRPVQPDHHRRQRLVTQRHHNPEPRPRQPCAEQHRLATIDDRPVAVVELHPQARLRRPRPRHPPVLAPPPTLRDRDPPPRRARRAEIAERDQLLVSLVRPDLPVRTIDQLIDLLLELTVHRRPLPIDPRQQPEVALAHPVRHRLVITPRQLRRSPQRAGQIVCLQDLHHFLRFLHAASTPQSSSSSPAAWQPTDSGKPWGERWPPTGRNPGRQWGVPVAAHGEVLMAAVNPAVETEWELGFTGGPTDLERSRMTDPGGGCWWVLNARAIQLTFVQRLRQSRELPSIT